MSQVDFKFDKVKLETIKSFLSAKHNVKIGILASSTKGSYPGIDAVVLAAVHEFGSKRRRIPERSFLRQTMFNYSDKFKLEMSLAKDLIFTKIANNQGEHWLNEVGSKWVRAVHDTFKVEGPGWDAHSDRNLKRRQKTGRAQGNTTKPEKWPLLQDTGALLRSINHEVVSG